MTVVDCEICGGSLPATLVEETTVATIAPMQAALCEVCQLVQDHTQPDGHCLECGDDVSPGYYIELEFGCGVEQLPGAIRGSLCADCAAAHAFRINYRGVENDDRASTEYTRLVDKQSQARKEMEEST